ncbi:hypothetical protein [Lichenicoccus sp.]|uniref:hypothetical protein n=1 Tax=Lichenicoccus sp. TaxID=2781899 RepID=UPI003D10828F
MFSETLNAQLLAALERPDLRVVSDTRQVSFDASLGPAFRVGPGDGVVLGPACLGSARVCAFHIRHALELSMLLDSGCDMAALAGLCAARTAALFWQLDGPSEAREPVSWLRAMAARAVPGWPVLERVWTQLCSLQGASGVLPRGVVERLGGIWAQCGPAESLMAGGGDARLMVDPRTGLNHYGCSHRPRPWAITFASSTASSLSERGFGGAEASRRRIAVACLQGNEAVAARREAQAVRQGIAAHYGLASGSEVVLAASGTDCELVVLALAECLGPVGSVLTAPEETGTGVPLAAGGMHFATDTSACEQVDKGAVVAGFRADTRVLPLAVRGADGAPRTDIEIEFDCAAIVQAERDAGRRVLLHLLDLSKTGLLAPSIACLERLQARHGAAIDIVVDACQARLEGARVRDYLARGWMVMITGSKFFTGPPFCGAALLPRAVATRLTAAGRLPAGLSAYCGRADWPELAATAALPDVVNLGMVLRWHAALAEMRAFGAVPADEVHARLSFFLSGVREAIAAHPSLALVDVPAPDRAPLQGSDQTGARSWDRLQTILSFLVIEAGVPLSLDRARRLYRWLNADVARALPAGASPSERRLGGTLCHIGQPAPVRHPALTGAAAGALRISAGARLLSGEPSHEGLDVGRRLAREVADARLVLDKIALLLRHWECVEAVNPEPSYAPNS